jgi:hypothetical protein
MTKRLDKEIKEILANDWEYYGNDGEMLNPADNFRKGLKIDLDAALKAVDEKLNRKPSDLDKDGFVRDDIQF